MTTPITLTPALIRPQMDEAVNAIASSAEIALVCHVNPDGDTLGSMLALGLALEASGKNVTMLSSDGVPPLLCFLPGSESIQTETTRRDFNLVIVVDAGEVARVGKNRELVETASHVMDIDHHVTPGAFGQIRLLDAKASATGEIIYDLLLALGAELTAAISTCLMTAILTDTGSFRYRNVTPRTMAIGGTLIALGAVPDEIAECVFENKPFAAQKMLGRALESLARTPDGQVVWAHVTHADFVEFGATDADTEGVVNAIRAVRGAEVALFFREMANGKLRVSLRAREPHDVASVAFQFGGGGHRLASGCTLEGPLADAEQTLVAAVVASLGARQSDPAACESPE